MCTLRLWAGVVINTCPSLCFQHSLTSPALSHTHTETAVNIGYSCKMLTDNMAEVFIISGHTVQSVRQELRSVCLRVCVFVCVVVKLTVKG